MDEKKIPANVSPERREFLEKLTKGAFVVPAVLSVMMLNQKLNLTTANAQSNQTGPTGPIGPTGIPGPTGQPGPTGAPG